MDLTNKIKNVFNNKEISDNKLAKLIHSSQPVITRYHDGISKIGNMRLYEAERIGHVYDRYMK